VPVKALYDPDAAWEITLRNLLQRRGYTDLNAMWEGSRKTGQLALVLRRLQRAIRQIPEQDN